MRFRKITTPDFSIDLPIADEGSDAAVRLWQSEDGEFHIGIEFGDGNRLALISLIEGATEKDVSQLAYTMGHWIRRISVVNDYGAALK